MTNYVLEILEGDRKGEVFALGETRLTIGRKPTNTLAFKDEKLSGEHCEIVLEGGHFVLRDLESTNGTFIDGRRITEVVLAAFDVFVAGRTRVIFKAAGAPNPGGDDLQLHRLDDQRLRSSGGRRGTAILVLALLLVAGVGAWLTFGSGTTDGEGPRGRVVAAEVVAGNLLDASVASCESTDGFEAVAGAGLGLGDGRTGRNALELVANAPEGGAAPRFGLGRTTTQVSVRSGDTLTVAGYVRTAAGGKAAVRLVLQSRGQGGPELSVTTGTTAVASEDWQRVHADVVVPIGFDQAAVEVLALLPEAGASASFDDLALTSSAAAARQDLGVGGRTFVTAGQSVLLLSTDNQPVVLGLAPLPKDEAERELAQRGLLVCSDQGASVAAKAVSDGFELTLTPGPSGFSGVELSIHPDVASGGLLVRGEDSFRNASAERNEQVREVVMGLGSTRLSVRSEAPVGLTVRPREQFTALWLDRAASQDPMTLQFVVTFGEVRVEARELLRQARQVQTTKPGQALDLLRRIVTELPQDDETLREASLLRGTLLATLGERFEALDKELTDTRFFDTQSGYQRLQAALDQLVEDYGEANIPQQETFAKMRADVKKRISELATEVRASRRAELERLAEMLDQNSRTSLGALVRNYLER